MVLQLGFVDPAGLAGLVALVPLVILYLVRPDPRELSLPTVRFLAEERDDGGAHPVLRRLTRDLLFLLQVLVVLALTAALASPYVMLDRQTAGSSTVVVLDTSASMATETGDGTRFDAARAAARDAVAGETTVVTTAPAAGTLVDAGGPADARDALRTVPVTDASGDLRGAISRAATAATSVDDGARVVVLSDFVDESGWRSAVRTARANGVDVRLRQFDGGGAANVGIVGHDVTERGASVTVRNTGTERAERTVSLGDQSTEGTLEPGDVRELSFGVPAGGGTVDLSPGDSFPTDDTAPVAAPADPTVEVLLVTNEPDSNLATALDVIGSVDLTVAQPPASVDGDYDVAIVGQVDAGEVLDSTVETVRAIAADGGGVAVVAQPDLADLGLGPISPVEPRRMTAQPGVESPADHDLTRNFEFPRPERALAANLTRGRALVNYTDGSPLLATASHGEGRVLYYGYVPDHSSFQRGVRYPIFWKRAVFHLADRPAVAELNRETGAKLQFQSERTVSGPRGDRTTTVATLDAVGTYDVDDRRYAAVLADPAESNVTAPSIDEVRSAGQSDGSTGTASVPFDLTPAVVALATLLVLLELAYLRRRGDL